MPDYAQARERILAAAMEQFLRRGYVAVSVREIIEPLGVSKGGFYHYFPSKEGLLSAVIERLLEGWADAGDRLAADSSKPVQERLRGLFLAPVERAGFSYALLYEGSRELGDGKARIQEATEGLVRRCEALLVEGQRTGEVRDFLDCAGWAFQIAATIEGAHLLSTLGGVAGLHDRLLRSFENTWRAVKALSL